MIQGGVNPELRLEWFERLFARVRAEFPQVDIHSLSVSEIAGFARVEELTPREVLRRLREAGLKSLPGAGAEILVERVRKRISARKVTPDAWLGVMRDAQLLGMPTTATMMFGSVETRRRAHRASCDVLRRLARRNGRLHGVYSLVLRTVQNPAARQGGHGAGVSARPGDLAPVSRQLSASASLVVDAGLEDGAVGALLRLRRYGRHDSGRARRARRGVHERSDARELEQLVAAPVFVRSSAIPTGIFARRRRSPRRCKFFSSWNFPPGFSG